MTPLKQSFLENKSLPTTMFAHVFIFLFTFTLDNLLGSQERALTLNVTRKKL